MGMQKISLTSKLRIRNYRHEIKSVYLTERESREIYLNRTNSDSAAAAASLRYLEGRSRDLQRIKEIIGT